MSPGCETKSEDGGGIDTDAVVCGEGDGRVAGCELLLLPCES